MTSDGQSTFGNPAIVAARWFIQGLVDAGVRHFCVCPGARSAPIAWALSTRTDIDVTVHVDERSAAFFALGMARTSGRPVMVSCTSGSALANLLPAVTEADHSRVPLVLATADRPPELQDRGAPQTMQQQGLFGASVRWCHDAGPPGPSAIDGDAWHRAAVRAVAVACGARPGPVHVNLPFREPLFPNEADRLPWTASPMRSFWHGAAATGDAAPLMRALQGAQRPLWVVGQLREFPGATQDELAAFVSAARAWGAPILACALSGLRTIDDCSDCGVIAHADVLARDPELRALLKPDLIVRVGATPTSKALGQWLGAECADVPMWLVEPSDDFREPAARPVQQIQLRVQALTAALKSSSPIGRGMRPLLAWRQLWLDADAALERTIDRLAADSGVWQERKEARGLPEEAHAMLTVVRSLGPDDLLQVASSMPVRDLDHVVSCTPGPMIASNRGLNGIDGTISTAAGAAWARRDEAGRTVVVLGDVAAIHDMTGLAATRLQGMRLTVVVINNDGGGIFGFLPINDGSDAFERFFSTPHGMDFRHAAAQFGATWQVVDSGEALAQALQRTAAGVHLIEVRTVRSRNRECYRALWPELLTAARGTLSAGPERSP